MIDPSERVILAVLIAAVAYFGFRIMQGWSRLTCMTADTEMMGQP